MTIQKETLVPLDESDFISHSERQKQKIHKLEAALAEKDDALSDLDFHHKMDITALKVTLRESCQLLAEGIKEIEYLESKIAALTSKLGTVKEVLRQLNNRDKRLREALEKPHRDCDPLRIING